jgi:hypothetical protein
MLAASLDTLPNVPNRKADLARRNGALSRGPATAEGKARSARNSTRHGICSRSLAPLDPEDAAALAGLRGALLARHQPLDEAEAHWVEELAAVAWRQRRLRALEDAVLVRATTGEAADPALPSLATVIRYRGRLDRDWRRATEELATLRRGRGDRLPEPDQLRRLARQIELARVLAAARPPASEPVTAAGTNEPTAPNRTNETPGSTNEPTAANPTIGTGEPAPPNRANDFAVGTNEPMHPVPPLPAGWPTPEPAAPARPLNRHQRRRLAALARRGLRRAA